MQLAAPVLSYSKISSYTPSFPPLQQAQERGTHSSGGFGNSKPGPPAQPRMWIWIGVPNVRTLHSQYLTSGAKIRNPPNNFLWALEMQIEDLDGNVLRIGSDPEEDKPLGVFRDADGVGWRHLGNDKYERE